MYRVGGVRVEAARVEPARVEPARVEPARVEAVCLPDFPAPVRKDRRSLSGEDGGGQAYCSDAAERAERGGEGGL